MLSSAKPKLEPYTNSLAKYFVKLNPNTLTLLGLLPPIIFLFAMMYGYYGIAILALVGSLFDMLDGAVARMTGRVTSFGGVLDSTFDRFSDGLLISAFGFAGIVRWELVIFVLIFSYLISYIRSRAELAGNENFKLDVGIMERTERIVLLGISLLLYIVLPEYEFYGINITEWIFILILMLSAITVVQRFIAANNKLQ